MDNEYKQAVDEMNNNALAEMKKANTWHFIKSQGVAILALLVSIIALVRSW